MNSLSIPETKQIEQNALAAVEQAKAIVINSDDTFQEAGLFLKGLKAIQKSIEDTFSAPIKAAHLAHKAIVAAKDKHYEPVEMAEKIIKAKLAVYHDQEIMNAAQEAEEMAKIARKRAEDEQIKLAASLESSGQKLEAAEVLREEITLPVIQARLIAKVGGVSFREKWDGKVENIGKLVQAIAAGTAPLTLIQVNETVLRQFSESTKGSIKVPGVQFFSTKVVSGKSS